MGHTTSTRRWKAFSSLREEILACLPPFLALLPHLPPPQPTRLTLHLCFSKCCLQDAYFCNQVTRELTIKIESKHLAFYSNLTSVEFSLKKMSSNSTWWDTAALAIPTYRFFFYQKCCPNFHTHINHFGNLVKNACSVVWGGAWQSVFLRSSKWYWGGWSTGPLWRMTFSNQPGHFLCLDFADVAQIFQT